MEDDKRKKQMRTTSYKAVSRRNGSRAGKYAAVIILLFAGCFTAGLGGGYVAYRFGPDIAGFTRGSLDDGNSLVRQDEQNISSVASKVGPSVVSITSKGSAKSFFGGIQAIQGAGSGIIISKDGYILTNKHVVSGSDQFSVTTSDGKEYTDVELLGTDPLNDLAFLKVGGVKDLRPASLGDSSSVRIGQNVVAIGNSLGEYQNTVTSGIISGTGRPISAQDGETIENLTDLLQTDAAINPGNSGGPLVNLSGQVIGINTAIAEDAQSIGFSIPINSAKGLIKHLLKTGKVERPYVGLNYIMITPEVQKRYKLPVSSGALVISQEGSAVMKDSPAEKAGLKSKDIVTKVGSTAVGEKGSLSSLVSQYSIGDIIDLTVLRNGETKTFEVTLEAYKE